MGVLLSSIDRLASDSDHRLEATSAYADRRGVYGYDVSRAADVWVAYAHSINAAEHVSRREEARAAHHACSRPAVYG